jgi:O-antigen/teichoic acid export membrane protein
VVDSRLGSAHPAERLLAQNALYNFLGQATPLVVAVVSIPYVVHGLGPERFGLLSLAWVVLGYFTIFDLGLGRATTKFVADSLATGDHERARGALWASLMCQLVFGTVGGILLFTATPLLVDRILNVPQALRPEAHKTFLSLSLGLPVVAISSSLYGALEGRQRFALVNAVRVPASAATYLLPALGVALHADLPMIILFLVVWRAAIAVLLFYINVRIHGTLYPLKPGLLLFRELLGFGLWVTVSNVINPLLVYLDRFVLAATLPVLAVGYYVVPSEAVSRLAVVPASVAAALFPVFSQLATRGSKEAAGLLMLRAMRIVGVLLAPVVLVIVVFSGYIMDVWLGPEFAQHSAPVLSVLALGILVNALAYAPYALLQAYGRADLTAKFHLLELPLHTGITIALVSKVGAIGAAYAWTVRVSLDALLLTWAALRLTTWTGALATARRAAMAAVSLGSAGVLLEWTRRTFLWERPPFVAGLLMAAVVLVAAYALMERLLLEKDDRAILRFFHGQP